jgi:Holliday junction resolvase RusA-like endonuclease
VSASLAEAPNSYRALPRTDLFTLIEFKIPWAPSVNNAYATAKNGGRFKVKRHKIFEQSVWVAMHEQNVPKKGIAHPCSVTLIQHAKQSARSDIDNGIKCVLDALKKFGVIHDDNRNIVKEVHVIDGPRCQDWQEPCVIVRIEPVFL